MARRRTPVNVASLVAGVVFCGIALAWWLVESGELRLSDLGLLVPVIFIGAGIVGLVASLRGGTRRRR